MMFDSSLVRFLSLVLVMIIVGYARYAVGYARLQKQGSVEPAAKKQLSVSSKKYSLVAAFLYMVAMVSVAGLFM